jgi:flagellar biogenesis protein FliO
MHRDPHAVRSARLSRKEWAFVALGLGAWIALAFGAVWFVHQFTRSRPSCGGRIEARTSQPAAPGPGPRNALQLLTGTGRCQ